MGIGFSSKKYNEVNKVVMLPLSQIHKNPNQPRKYFDPAALQELARSIAANGLLQPVTVRKISEDLYELVAGERRTLAYQCLGREQIPAIIEQYTKEQSAVLALIENLQRKDLNYFEEADGIEKLMHELGLNQQQVSQKLGMAQSTVANKLRLLKYPPELRQMMVDANFTERHARALLKLPDANMQKTAIDLIVQKNLNVEQTERLIQNMLAETPERTGRRLFIIKDMRVFMNSIQKAVDIMNQAGVPVTALKAENDEYVEVLIKIPRAAVYVAPSVKRS